MIKTGEAKQNQDLKELGLSRHESKINIEFNETESRYKKHSVVASNRMQNRVYRSIDFIMDKAQMNSLSRSPTQKNL